MLKWLSLITLLALVAGIGVGALVAGADNAAATGVLREIGHIGDLWLNLLRMTVIPLVFSLLVTGIASVADAAASGGWRRGPSSCSACCWRRRLYSHVSSSRQSSRSGRSTPPSPDR